jgi:predicted amidohydrolase YtcJ
MMSRKILWFFLPLVFLIVLYIFMRSSQRDAGMLLINGNIYTFDSSNTVAQAVAIKGNAIIAVGSSADLLRAYKTNDVIDLNGKTVFPGLVDGHAHVLGEGGRLQTLDLIGSKSPEDIAQLVKDRVKTTKKGDWIIGRGWDQNDWAVKEFPTHAILDIVAPDNPVLLRRVDGHAIWVNAKTLELTNLSYTSHDNISGDPEGGKIYRDQAGAPTGIFVDNAVTLVDRIVPPLTDDEIEQRLTLAMNECARYGLTEIHDMGVDLQTIKIYKRLIDRGECPVRIYAAIDGPGETWNYYREHGKEIGYGDGLLTVRALKLYIDGALGSRGAALVEGYSDDQYNRGLTIVSEESLSAVCRQALDHNFQVCTHAIGDRGNHIMLNIYERVFNAVKGDHSDQRWRIEHVQVLLPFDNNRFIRIGILPSMQPTHATSDMPWAETRLGPERIKNAYAWRSILQTGAHIIGGSDFPVESVNPLFGIYAAITRQDKNGYPESGWYSGQKMTREEAVRAFTSWAAYGAFQENEKGTIETGKMADLTVLSNNIMTIAPKQILDTHVEMTIVNGIIVYQNK